MTHVPVLLDNRPPVPLRSLRFARFLRRGATREFIPDAEEFTSNTVEFPPDVEEFTADPWEFTADATEFSSACLFTSGRSSLHTHRIRCNLFSFHFYLCFPSFFFVDTPLAKSARRGGGFATKSIHPFIQATCGFGGGVCTFAPTGSQAKFLLPGLSCDSSPRSVGLHPRQ